MSNVPTIEEEVTRKGLNALAMVQADKENSRINIDTFNYVMRVLHEAFAGIVDKEFINIMNQMTTPKARIIDYESDDGKHASMEINVTDLTINIMGRLIQCRKQSEFIARLDLFHQDLKRRGFKRVK